MHFPGVPRHTFRLPKPKSRCPFLPNDRSNTREVTNDHHGWTIYTDGDTRVVDGEIFAGRAVISRSPCGRIFVLFGPVITNEAHLAFSGARIHSNNTAEMSSMFEALSFLAPRGPVTHDELSRIFFGSVHAAGKCLGTIQARTHEQLALACQQSMIRAQHRLRLTCNMCLVTVVIGATNAPIMLLPLALWVSSPDTMSPRVGVVTTLTPLYVSMGATASARLLNDYSTIEQMLRRYIGTEFSIGTSHRVLCARCAPHVIYRFVDFFCGSQVSAFSELLLCQQVMDWLSSSASSASSIDDYSRDTMWNPLFELLFFELVNGIVDSYLVDLDLAKIAFLCHFALDLLCYKEEVSVSARWYIGHHCPWNSFFWCGTMASPVTSTCYRTKKIFISDCMQKKSLYPAGKWFPKFTDFRKLVLPSRTLFTSIEIAGVIEVTFHA